MRTASSTWEKQGGFYQNKVTSSPTPIQRPRNQARNCKMVYFNEWKLIFITKTSHSASPWHGGRGELGNGLFNLFVTTLALPNERNTFPAEFKTILLYQTQYDFSVILCKKTDFAMILTVSEMSLQWHFHFLPLFWISNIRNVLNEVHVKINNMTSNSIWQKLMALICANE